MVHLFTNALLLASLSRGLAVVTKTDPSPDGSASDRKPLMRLQRDSLPESSMVHLGASGELVERERPESSPQSGEMDFCGEAYVLGQASVDGEQTKCTVAAEHSLILREALCRAAASEAGAQEGTPTAKFTVDYDNIDKCPIGCFKDATKNVFFYNPNGDWPSTPEKIGGTPVCHRKRYQNGTLDNNAGCPSGYANNLEEEACRSVAKCEGYCTTEYFRVGLPAATNAVKNPPDPRPTWAANYNGMPKGCFIREEDGCVYFNVAQAAAPTAPKGIPVCSIATFAAA